MRNRSHPKMSHIKHNKLRYVSKCHCDIGIRTHNATHTYIDVNKGRSPDGYTCRNACILPTDLEMILMILFPSDIYIIKENSLTIPHTIFHLKMKRKMLIHQK